MLMGIMQVRIELLKRKHKGVGGMIGEYFARLMIIIALTCVPTSIIYAYITDPTYRNPFSLLVLLFYIHRSTYMVKKKKRNQ